MSGAGEGSQGAPWWLTVTLPFLSAAVTHYFTQWRERKKRDNDWQLKWLDDTKKLLAKISDSAIQHYIDPASEPKTAVSAALIISDIKRLSGLIGEARCSVSSDSKVTSDALHAFNTTITDPEDFQDTGRSVRPGNDAICAQIRACEQVLLTVIQKPRVKQN